MIQAGVVLQERMRKLARVGVVLAVLVATCGIGIGLSAAAPKVDPKCNGVFNGQTPNDPIVKTANKAQASPGDSVTYTISWTSTGNDSANVTDCFRVDDGSENALNALVEPGNYAQDVSQPEADTPMTLVVTVQIPNDASLIGHTVYDRAKITHGSQESRSDLIGVEIVCTENCGSETTTGGTTTGSSTGDTTGGTTTGGSTGDTTGGTTTGGTTSGTSGTVTTGSSTGGTTSGNEVLGRVIHRKVAKKALATTGSETTALAWLGLAMLMVGMALRFGRFGIREAYAVASGRPSKDDMITKAIRTRSRDWTCGG
jgi:hypothetical protein